jgi:hypothetical protein
MISSVPSLEEIPMGQAAYGSVSDDALVGFDRALTDGPWSAVDASEWLPRKSGKGRSLADAPVLVPWKQRQAERVIAIPPRLLSMASSPFNPTDMGLDLCGAKRKQQNQKTSEFGDRPRRVDVGDKAPRFPGRLAAPGSSS